MERIDDECACTRPECECEIPRALERRIERAVSRLNVLMVEVRAIVPTAGSYLECGGNFNVMSGPAHTGPHQKARHDRVMMCCLLRWSDGGGW